MKRIHWTQTPEGKKKLAANRKAKANGTYTKPSTARPSARPSHADKPAQEVPSDLLAYALGRVEGFLDAYCQSADLPYQVVATELGKVLQRKSSRKILGTRD